MTKQIRGSGGAPKRPPAPVREPDTLDSRQFATIQDLVSEGEIEGFPSAKAYTRDTTNYDNAALKDIYFDKTPVLDANADVTNLQDSDYNFKDVEFTPRYGTSNQDYITGLKDSVASPTNVGVTVTQSGGGVSRQIQAAGGGADDPDAVRVTLTWPQIQKAEDDGDLRGSSVSLKIQIKYNGESSYTDLITDTVTGRTGDAYQKDYLVNLDHTKNSGNAFPLDIKVVRTTADSGDESLKDSFTWTSFTTVIDEKQRYLNSAYFALRVDSKQFSSIPQRSYRLRGVKIRLPNNASVDSNTGRVTYSGAWNGTFGAAQWCSCPSWILYDLLCSQRYGFGEQILTDAEKSSFNGNASRLDKFSFYAASVYANELVSDGFGGQEARFSCNVSIQTPTEAFDLINELAGVMRCMPFWGAGSITLSQDKPTTTSYLFNLSNVSPEGFTYSGTSLKTRHTVFVVSYFNMDSIDIDYETYEDTANVTKWGSIIKQVKAFACTSRGQAQRLGKYLAFTEQRESEVITFKTSINSGTIVRPGMVISVIDPVRSGIRRGGRISAASTTVITVDNEDATDLSITGDAKLSVILPDGLTEIRNVNSKSGAAITVASAYSQAPAVGSIWLLENNTVEAEEWRILSVAEEDEGANYVITASPYIEGKYANIESGITLPARNVSVLNAPATPPADLGAEEKIVVINGKAVPKIIVSWKPSVGIIQYQLQYRFEKGTWYTFTVASSSFEIENSQIGEYEFKVAAFNINLSPSNLTSDLTFNAVGKTTLPSNVANLSFEGINTNSARLTWDKATDVDVLHGGRVHIRHSSLTNGTGTWSNSTDLINSLAGNSTQAVVPLMTGEYIAKFADDTGNFSDGETSIIITAPAVDELLVGLQQREDTGNFPGTKTNTVYDATYDALKLTDPSANATGTYEFQNALDLGAIFNIDLERVFATRGLYPSDLIDSRTDLIDTWTDFDGTIPDKVNAVLKVSTSDDASSYGPFAPFANGTFRGRGFKFKSTLSTTDVAQNILVDQLGFQLKFTRRTEQSTAAIASGTSGSGKDITFGKSFFTGTSVVGGSTTAYLPSIGITAYNMASGDYFAVSSVTGTGFTVIFKNIPNSVIDRNFSYTAVGFGRGS
jgi:predicted phage tail protein